MGIPKIILATRNKHKTQELKSFLSELEVELLTLNDVQENIILREDGITFEENALQKARIVYEKTGIPSLADDSGLEVFYLNGRPGVFSARYAGENATDEMNNQKLLEEMRGVPPRRRGARFKSVLAFVGDGFETLTEGVCLGTVIEFPRGTNGFGYDPLFIPEGFNKTYAELTAEEKNLISHRARSFAKMKEVLLKKYGFTKKLSK